MRRHGPLLRPLDAPLARRMLGYGARAYLVTLVAYLLIRIDLLLVNGIQGARPPGSTRLRSQSPMRCTCSRRGRDQPVRTGRRGTADRDISLSVFHLVAVGYLLVCAIAALLAEPAITLLFGAAYHPAIELLWRLLPGVYCLGLLNVIAYYFAAQGMPKELVLVWIPDSLSTLRSTSRCSRTTAPTSPRWPPRSPTRWFSSYTCACTPATSAAGRRFVQRWRGRARLCGSRSAAPSGPGASGRERHRPRLCRCDRVEAVERDALGEIGGTQARVERRLAAAGREHAGEQRRVPLVALALLECA